MQKTIVSFDSDHHCYKIMDGDLEVNKIYIFSSTGIKFILTPHNEGRDMVPGEIILKENKHSQEPYRVSKFKINKVKSVSKFYEDIPENQYNIETHNLFIFCVNYEEFKVPNSRDKVVKNEDNFVIGVSRREYLELPITYIKGIREVSTMYLPTSSYKIYKQPKDLYIEAQTLIKNFKNMHINHPEKDTDINLLFGNPCIDVRLKDYEESL